MDNWKIEETKFNPEEIRTSETIFTIGNGYLSTRGAFEETYPWQQAVTLINGVYDDAPLVHTELANIPNWHNIEIVIGEQRFSMKNGKTMQYNRQLDLRTGTLKRSVVWQISEDANVQITYERFASLADAHIVALRTMITVLEGDADIIVQSGISGFVDNASLRHWDMLEQRRDAASDLHLTVQTKETGIVLCEAATMQISSRHPVDFDYWDVIWSPQLVAKVSCKQGDTIVIDKLVSIFSSFDSNHVQSDALAKLKAIKSLGFDRLKADNEKAWAATWDKCNITIEGDNEVDLAIRFSLYQLLIAAPRWSDRISIPAKTLSGYGYRGHIFWDTEIFMLPFFIYTQPELAKNMLMYRYHTLPGARRKARQNGYQGAMYSWESAATGDETTPSWLPVWIKESNKDELVRIWCGDIELHITTDVAYGIMHYWQITGDDVFMHDYGVEIILSAALFWCSRAEYNSELDIYELSDVIGPDEYHDHVKNNAYTNEMIRWHLQTAIHVAKWLSDVDEQHYLFLAEKLDLSDHILSEWRKVAAGMFVNMDSETGLIEQFDGFFDLKDVDWEEHKGRTTSMQAILGIEEVQKYQILKQPDVLMLLYLLADKFSPEIFETNWNYYTPRTDHSYGSSLGPAIQSALAFKMGDIKTAYTYLKRAAFTDLKNNRGNTGDGIHAATAGGLWQAVIFGIAGIRPSDNTLVAHPLLPDHWTGLKFKLYYRGEYIDFSITK